MSDFEQHGVTFGTGSEKQRNQIMRVCKVLKMLPPFIKIRHNTQCNSIIAACQRNIR
jgi:hypothetical protein